MTVTDCAHCSGDPVGASDAPAWVLLPGCAVPERWRGRGHDVVLVPLLPEELSSVLAGTPASPLLDERDERLARLVAAGASIPQMARDVGLSTRGVQHRLARLRDRFGVATTAELIAQLVRRGLATASRGNATPKDPADAATNPPNQTPSPASDPEGARDDS